MFSALVALAVVLVGSANAQVAEWGQCKLLDCKLYDYHIDIHRPLSRRYGFSTFLRVSRF
jgi:hypothetical protein